MSIPHPEPFSFHFSIWTCGKSHYYEQVHLYWENYSWSPVDYRNILLNFMEPHRIGPKKQEIR